MRCSTSLATTIVLLFATTPVRALRAQDQRLAAPNDSAVSASGAVVGSANVTPRTLPPGVPGALPADSTYRGGAALTGLRAGVHLAETLRASQPNAAATNPHLGQARAMMVVGGAALLTGAIIGGESGTIIMVGGAIIGLYGLYQYLQ